MPILLWDSSALGKRYVVELGSDTVDALFALSLPLVTFYMVFAEPANIIRRNRNHGLIDASDFFEARRGLEREILYGPNVTLLSIDDAAILASIPLADAHNLNATDAALLHVLGDWARGADDACVLVATDGRLIRAATAEGMSCLNRESVRPADLGALLPP